MKTRIQAFVVYSILYEALIWGIFGYAVFIKGFSSWWILFALVLSSCQFKPSSFGITTRNVDENYKNKMNKFTFSGTAKEVRTNVRDSSIRIEYGVWTDGIGLYSDNAYPCAYILQPGTKYKITVELENDPLLERNE